MATPMITPGACCQCWESHNGGTFDVGDTLTLVDVCASCRWWETRHTILQRAEWSHTE